MAASCQALSEKEKQTLRLIVRGHDAKSAARHLDLSVHTINERLRDARRKLEVSSSREAARLLFESESHSPQKLADKKIGEDTPARPVDDRLPGTDAARPGRSIVVIAGLIMMSIFVGLAVLALAPGGTVLATTGSAAVAAVESDAVRSARDWLVLGDQGRWKDGWLATSSEFRKLNTAERWEEAATKVRVPLGALVSRTALSQESVPAPPAGVEVVKFRTSFANRANVIETVSLVREEGKLKVVGIYVD